MLTIHPFSILTKKRSRVITSRVKTDVGDFALDNFLGRLIVKGKFL